LNGGKSFINHIMELLAYRSGFQIYDHDNTITVLVTETKEMANMTPSIEFLDYSSRPVGLGTEQMQDKLWVFY
jgi:hypothetical protein